MARNGAPIVGVRMNLPVVVPGKAIGQKFAWLAKKNSLLALAFKVTVLIAGMSETVKDVL
jgi:hypothetical protein